jgi:radical SAM protein with 4Fe4S-binding SPASM domain
MISYAKNAGIRTRFHTNGALMKQPKADSLLDSGPDLVSFSIDGFTKELYEQIRVGADFETTVENIIYLASQKKLRKLKKPYIVIEKINFRNINEEGNIQNIKALIKRFLDAGVDEIIEKEEYAWAEENAPEPKIPRSSSICTFPWYAMVICADGTVTPCPQDFWAKMNLGNVKNSSLKEIWNGKEYQNIRQSFNKKENLMPLCKKCDRLRRNIIGGIPFQYMVTFLVDQLAGYGKIRKLFGTSERN